MTTHSHARIRIRVRHTRPALAALALAAACAPACAGLFAFDGETDAGSLAGETFGGRFAYADPVAGFSGEVGLDRFEMAVFGRRYTLDDADAGTTPVAWFDAGVFLGIDYFSAAARPAVQLLAGFSDIDEAYFAYRVGDDGTDGFGNLRFTRLAQPVPAPATLVLALAGLALMGGVHARRGRAA